MDGMRILVTGGAGYIGSHTVVDLLGAGAEITIADDFRNSEYSVIDRVQAISGRPVHLVEGDIKDTELMTATLRERDIDAVIHFAASKAVDESMRKPELYFRNNLGGMMSLCEAMRRADVGRIVFSSSAAVYGEFSKGTVTEAAPLHPGSPYGLTKKQCEEILHWNASIHRWGAVSLRYFNPVGAHASGLIGEAPREPQNLMPLALMAATGERSHLTLFGTDYDTPDGTTIRDYIHVCDLARAHRLALGWLGDKPKLGVFNIGTGRGHSVREVVDAVSEAIGRRLPVVEGPRRPGDIVSLVANADLAHLELGFKTQHGLAAMADSAWAWWAGARSATDRGHSSDQETQIRPG